ncbi:biotin/lipoyl-containing protein, partial [Achromobacter xylosoxidans]
MSNVVQIKVPDIGDFKEVEVIEVLVAVGDTIKAEQSLITVESDKASMEIPASQGGVVKSIAVKVGDKVAEGAVVLEVEAADAAAAPAAKEEPKAEAPRQAAAAAPAAKAEAAAPAASSGPVEIEVPDIGDFKEVEVIEVMVAVGDTIKAEQSLITVESDKASMEIPASQGGVVKEVKVKVGDKVAKGSVVVVVEGSAPAAAAAPAAKAEAALARSEAPAAKAEAPA